MSLSPEAQSAVTAAAVNLLRAGVAGVDGPVYDQLVAATLRDLYTTHGGAGATTFALLSHLITTMSRMGTRLAQGWDDAADGAPALAYLSEVGSLAKHGRE